MEITSIQNPKIKYLLKLQQKSKLRKQDKLFVVEGVQENTLALEAGYEPTSFFIESSIFKNEINIPKPLIINVSKEVFEKIAYRNTTGGIIGIYHIKDNSLNAIPTQKNPLFIVLEGVEKPGNLGAILRTGDAVNATAIVVCDSKVDFYNPNVVRSSVGTLFTNNLVATNKQEWVEYCQKKQVKIASTFLREDTQNLYNVDFKNSVALVFGTEADGLSDFWLNYSDETIKIPMHGKVDSLNVSNAVAVCVYEALRQRDMEQN